MLGIFGVIVLVLGGFSAGGGIFDWPFLFSDGYREYNWVRSTGREGARGMLVLIGGILLVVGFVAQVIDSAAPLSLDPGRGIGPARFAQSMDERATTDGTTTEPGAAPWTSAAPSGVTAKAPQVAAPTIDQFPSPPGADAAQTTSAAPVKRPASTAPAWQPMRIFDPELVPQESDTLLTLQYQFEEGHRPVRGGHYFWVIDMLGVTTEVEYDAEVLREQGQLTHILRTPFKQSEAYGKWSTSLVVELNGRRQQVSNSLEIAPGAEVRSIPMPAPPQQ